MSAVRLKITPLGDLFGARIEGIDVRHISNETFALIRRQLDESGVLVLPGQPLDDAGQVRFSERFGPLESTVPSNPAAGTPFARQSNLDVSDGSLIPPSDERMRYQRGNMRQRASGAIDAKNYGLRSGIHVRGLLPLGISAYAPSVLG